MDNMQPSHEKDIMEQKLIMLSARWKEVSNTITSRGHQLQTVEPSARKYQSSAESFTRLLSEAEDRIKSCEEIPSDQESMSHHIDILEVCSVVSYRNFKSEMLRSILYIFFFNWSGRLVF